jgi:diguanylate cyclase (GGDEF)-like protein/PAS domain S-box-containing protein
LVVEDNPQSRKWARAALSNAGYDVLEARDGAQAIDRACTHVVDLVVQDVVLPDMDGFDLLGRLRTVLPRRDVPILAVTGGMNEALLREAGFNDVLTKPIEPARLVKRVHAHLDPTISIDLTHDLPSVLQNVLESYDTGEIAPYVDERAISSLQKHASRLAEMSDRDRVWSAVSQILECLTEVTSSDLSREQAFSELLGTFLHAGGFCYGALLTRNRGGAFNLSASLGFRGEIAVGLPKLWGHVDRVIGLLAAQKIVAVSLRESSPRAKELLYSAGMGSMIIVPLRAGEELHGLLVVATQKPELRPEWTALAEAVSGPIAHATTLMATVSRLKASEHRFRGIAEAAADGLILEGANGLMRYANPAAAKILGVPEATLIDRAIESFVAVPAPDQPPIATRIYRDRELVPVEISVRSFEDSRVYVITDLSEKLRAAELLRLASHDALTGLFNRRRFEEEMRGRLAEARRYGGVGAMLLLDLDGFKAINDTHGHQAGDAVLIAVGELLRKSTRETDSVARFGGDELAVLLPHADSAAARACAEKLLAAIQRIVVNYKGVELRVGVSIGVARYLVDGETPEALYAAADAALYRAKRGGKNRVEMAG